MYTLGPNGDSLGPPFQGLREFWQRSFSGRYSADYEAGVLLGQADVTGNVDVGFHALDSVTVGDRDNAWDARLDGLRDAYRVGGRPVTKYEP